MNILLIGNGFDLAHGLPTKYTDFLEFIKVINGVINTFEKKKTVVHNDIEWYSISENLKDIIKENLLNSSFDRLKNLIEDNIWISYFLQCDMHGEENWIDFESEISSVIKSIDKDIRNDIEINSLYDDLPLISNEFIYQLVKDKSLTCKQLINKLLNDLDNLIASLEIYLSDYVEKIKIDTLIIDIKELASKVDKLISFNYTHTYETVYKRKEGLEVDYLHGEAKINNSVRENNMVLGIDEYLPEDEQRKFVEFIGFKKFYQRIYKKTGCKYRKWIDKMDELYQMLRNNAQDNNLYIFGHSLDVTDGDILRDLILNRHINHITIYYRKKEQLGEEIANLVKVIGEEELIRRTGGKNATIEFKMQKEV